MNEDKEIHFSTNASSEFFKMTTAGLSEMRNKATGGLNGAVSHERVRKDTVEDGCVTWHSRRIVINTTPLIHRSHSFSAGLLVTFINPGTAAFSWPFFNHPRNKRIGPYCCGGVILRSSWPGHRGASLTTSLSKNVYKGFQAFTLLIVF